MGAIPNTPACGCLRWVLASLLFLSHAEAYNHTWNRNYFNFPPLTDWIPVFRVGDTLNISWSTEFPQRNIAVWCGPDFYLVQSFNDLDAVGYQLVPVLESWNDPCHLEFYSSNYAALNGSFNSGAFNVNTAKAATPTTWAADDLNSACPTFYTAGNGIPTATSSSSTAATTSQSCGTEAASKSSGGAALQEHSSSPSFGAGIGVGIALSVGIAILSSLIWFLLARRRSTHGRPELPNSQVAGVAQPPNAGGMWAKYAPQQHYYQQPSELPNDQTNELPTQRY